MRSFICILMFSNMLLAKEIIYKIQSPSQQDHQIISIHGAVEQQQQTPNTRSTRDDTTTIWLQDFEGDISDWTVDAAWELTEESSYSPTHSFHIDDDNYDVVASLASPVLSVPALTSENELIKLNFALWVDFPDFDGDGDNYLEDYYWVDIANVSDVPVYFHPTSSDAYDGQSWWCGDPGVGGYLDAWVQVLNSPEIQVPVGGTLSAMMKWGIEDYTGAAVGGT